MTGPRGRLRSAGSHFVRFVEDDVRDVLEVDIQGVVTQRSDGDELLHFSWTLVPLL